MLSLEKNEAHSLVRIFASKTIKVANISNDNITNHLTNPLATMTIRGSKDGQVP